MAKVKAQVLERLNIKSIVWSIALILIVGILPRFIHNQFITGPIVNATLFLGTVILGPASAMLIGLVPSVVALASGLLPMPLAPMVPFIMISNAILVWTFSYFRKINFGSGVVVASLVKYAFLYGTSLIVVNLISNQNIAAKAVTTMMAWPQIVTALIGGVIAFGVLKAYKAK